MTEQLQGRQRPREAEASSQMTGDDLPSLNYAEYYNCGWPAVVRSVGVAFKYEILTRGLEDDWPQTTSSGGIGVSNDVREKNGSSNNPLVDLLKEQIPKKAQQMLGVKECKENEGDRRLTTSGGGIVQIISGGGSYDDDVGNCTSFQFRNVDTACTPLKGSADIVYDPEVTDAQQASKIVMSTITEAMVGGENRDGGSLFSDNIVGMQMTEMTDIVESDFNYDKGTSNGEKEGVRPSTSQDGFIGTDSVAVGASRDDATRGGLSGSTSNASGGMNGGAVAGLVIGLLVMVAAGLFALFVMRKQKTQNKGHRLEDDEESTRGQQSTGDKENTNTCDDKTATGESIRDDHGLCDDCCFVPSCTG